MEKHRERRQNPSNNKQRSAEDLMYITNSLTVQEEEFAQLKYSDVETCAAVCTGVRGSGAWIEASYIKPWTSSRTTETFTFSLLKVR
jgi:hypothetical protein